VVAAIVILVLAVTVVAIIILAVDQSNTEERNALERCQATNEGRVAIQDAFSDDHSTQEAVIAEFVNEDSPTGQKFLERLKAENRATERRLALRLPQLDCSET
jgi:hypothetical protein